MKTMGKYTIEVIIDAGNTRTFDAIGFNLSGGILTINTADGSAIFNFDAIIGYIVTPPNGFKMFLENREDGGSIS